MYNRQVCLQKVVQIKLKDIIDNNQSVLESVQESNPKLQTILSGLILDSTLRNKFSPESGHKITIGDMFCDSPVVMLLAGYASGTLKVKMGYPEVDCLKQFMNEYYNIIHGFSLNGVFKLKKREQVIQEISKLASKLIIFFQPVVSGPLIPDAHSGLLFLIGNHMNDQMNSVDYRDYSETLSKAMSLLSSAGAEFIRGNKGIADFLMKDDVTVLLKDFFLPALYVSETKTLYTHKGITLGAKELEIFYAFSEPNNLNLAPETTQAYGQQIYEWITNKSSYYSARTDNPVVETPRVNKPPLHYHFNLKKLEICATKLGIKQVVWHSGKKLLSGNNVTCIKEGTITMDGYTLPIITITGM